MAQADSNAQREPSMEEILASIRRIIEDNEAEASENTASSAAQPEDAEEAETSAPQSDENADDIVSAEAESEPAAEPEADSEDDDGLTREEWVDEEVETFREELSADDEPEDDSSMSALSLSDIQAEVAKQVSTEADTDDADSTDAAEISSLASADDAAEEAETESAEAESEEEDDKLNAGSLAALAESMIAEDLEEAVSAEVEPPAIVTNGTGAETVPTNKTPIISEQAGRQVAAAFDQLSEAFSQSRTKSFDEMAEDMMRPMLQDWLDNNLPVLVEKLVREEIDRVARGASR